MKKIWIIITLLLLVAIVSLQICHVLGLLSPNGKQIVCPVNAIKMHKGKAIIDNDKCIGCARCVNGFYAVNNKEEDATESATSSSSSSDNSSLSEDKTISADNKANSTEDKATSANNKQIPLGKTTPSNNIKSTPATPKNYHKVNTQECIGCGLCVKACPTNAISMKNGKAIIDKDKCINCGICRGINEDVFTGCPVDAIVAVKDSL